MIPRILPTTNDAAIDEAVERGERELQVGREAMLAGNDGRARVCARRGVAAVVQALAPRVGRSYGENAMANLHSVGEDPTIPDEIRAAAARLLGGVRTQAAGGEISADPVADAVAIIEHLVTLVPRPS